MQECHLVRSEGGWDCLHQLWLRESKNGGCWHNHIKPILFSFRGDKKIPGEGSELAVLIEAKMKDYLERKSDGKLIEGSRKKKNVERVWSFTFEKGNWVVSNIDEGTNSHEYIEMMKTVPKIEEAMELHGITAVNGK